MEQQTTDTTITATPCNSLFSLPFSYRSWAASSHQRFRAVKSSLVRDDDDDDDNAPTATRHQEETSHPPPSSPPCAIGTEPGRGVIITSTTTLRGQTTEPEQYSRRRVRFLQDASTGDVSCTVFTYQRRSSLTPLHWNNDDLVVNQYLTLEIGRCLSEQHPAAVEGIKQLYEGGSSERDYSLSSEKEMAIMRSLSASQARGLERVVYPDMLEKSSEAVRSVLQLQAQLKGQPRRDDDPKAMIEENLSRHYENLGGRARSFSLRIAAFDAWEVDEIEKMERRNGRSTTLPGFFRNGTCTSQFSSCLRQLSSMIVYVCLLVLGLVDKAVAKLYCLWSDYFVAGELTAVFIARTTTGGDDGGEKPVRTLVLDGEAALQRYNQQL